MKWRVGTKVPLNVYDATDKPICQCHTEESAAFLVDCVNHRTYEALIDNGAFAEAERYFSEKKPEWACPGYGHHGHNCRTCTGCTAEREAIRKEGSR